MARVGYYNLPRLTYQLVRDTYVCTMYDVGYSHCYLDVSYNMSRSGNTMRYTVRVAVRMGNSGSFSQYKWLLKLRAGGIYDSGWVLVKGFQDYGVVIGTDWFYTDYNFSVNTNTGTTPLSVSWMGLNFYDDFVAYYINNRGSGSVSYITPSAPTAPSSALVPSSIAPDKVASLSWDPSSGGTNGVSGYEWVYSLDGGASWIGYDTYTNSTSASLDLDNAGFKQNSKLKIAVRSYSTVNNVKFKSGWTYSDTTVTKFVAPSAPKNLNLIFDTDEPIPIATYTGSWSAPDSGGTNGVSGYTFSWLKNGNEFTADSDLGNILSNVITLTENYEVGSKISFRVRAYTIGQGAKYYGDFSTSGTITIVSDKYIFVSFEGGAFDKRKMFISINGEDFKEVKKDKFKLL